MQPGSWVWWRSHKPDCLAWVCKACWISCNSCKKVSASRDRFTVPTFKIETPANQAPILGNRFQHAWQHCLPEEEGKKLQVCAGMPALVPTQVHFQLHTWIVELIQLFHWYTWWKSLEKSSNHRLQLDVAVCESREGVYRNTKNKRLHNCFTKVSTT
jgi:hypothetical protein